MAASGRQKQKVAWVLAGGTGGHIFPALAVAEALQEKGWLVRWVGAPDSMEERVVSEHGIAMDRVDFRGVRGKGLLRWLKLPAALWQAFRQSREHMQAVQPDVVLGFGGYISFPAGLAAYAGKVPLVLHEQNAVAGMANKLLARLATQVFTAFPDVLSGGEHVGNPLRAAFMRQAKPRQRFASRLGRLRLLVVGGSLGASALNKQVPRALALMSEESRPDVVHQSGEKHLQKLRENYAKAGVSAKTVAFIEDMAGELAKADVVVCRAGASTVTEIAAVGVGAIFVPYPHAVDDHQTVNAMYLVGSGAGRLLPQNELTPQGLSSILSELNHEQCLRWARAARRKARLDATARMVSACERLCKEKKV